jgi:hypothetical protein
MRDYRASTVMEMNHYFPLHHHQACSCFTLESKAPQATTSSTTAVEVSRVEGEIISESGASSQVQKAHPPQQIICNLNERVTHSSWSAHLAYFTNALIVALFEP